MRWTQAQLDEYLLSLQTSAANPATISDDAPPDEGRESKLQAKIESWARERGYPFFHDRSRRKNKAGWPDLTICLTGGIVLFLELKSAKGILRPEQKHIRQQMLYLGHHHFVVKSYKGFLSIIRDHDYAD